MRLRLTAEEVDQAELQTEMDAAWHDAVGTPELVQLLDGHGVDDEALASDPFVATPAEEGFGVVELILIAAAGRLAASLPERLLVRIFDEVVWPRLQRRFGDALGRSGDDR